MARIFIFLIGVWSVSGLASPLPLIKARLGAQEIRVEVAEAEDHRARGLMYRRTLAANQGMLFVFDEEALQTFWMKNTLIPLSIGFFDRNLKLVDVQEMVPPSTFMALDLPRYTSQKPALLALEMNRQWFKRHKIPLGAKLELLEAAPTPKLRALGPSPRPKSKSENQRGQKTGLGK